jgi:hypothetical protein
MPPTESDEPAISPQDRTIGTVVESRSQMDYVVEVYRERDREHPPEKDDFAFGQPVYGRTTVRGEPHALVGVVYDSRLVGPEQGRDGPRLSNPDQEMFVPGYVDEKQTLLGVAFLGTAGLASRDGGPGADFDTVDQQLPRWTLDVDDPIQKLSPTGFEAFHVQDGDFAVEYYDRLVATADTFGAEVTLRLVDRLRSDTDVREGLLDVIEQKVRWETKRDRGVLR